MTGPELGVGVGRVADADAPATSASASTNVVVDAALHEQPAAGDAGLAGADEAAEGGTARGDVDGGVVEDEHRGLAAELEGGLGEAAGPSRARWPGRARCRR